MASVYIQVSEVNARNPARAVSASTSPTDTQAQAWIEEAEAFINGALLVGNLPAPYTVGTNAAKILGMIVGDYAEGRIRIAYAAAGGDGQNKDGEAQVEKFYETCKDIKRNPETWAAMLGAGSPPVAARRNRGHVTDNADGETVDNGDFDPIFDRSETL